MKMHVLSGGRLRMKKNIYFPDADDKETVELPVSCMLMKHGQGNVLFDTGCHPGILDNPEARWGKLAQHMTPIMPPGDHVEAARAPDANNRGYIAADWDHPIPLKLIDQQTDLFGDGRITLIPLPGHTPGSIGALVKLDRSGEFLLASDALSIRANLDREVVPKNTRDIDQFLQSFSEIRRMEKSGVKVICGHDSAQWESLRKGADAYD